VSPVSVLSSANAPSFALLDIHKEPKKLWLTKPAARWVLVEVLVRRGIIGPPANPTLGRSK
jgi:hypothetical protein